MTYPITDNYLHCICMKNILLGTTILLAVKMTLCVIPHLVRPLQTESPYCLKRKIYSMVRRARMLVTFVASVPRLRHCLLLICLISLCCVFQDMSNGLAGSRYQTCRCLFVTLSIVVINRYVRRQLSRFIFKHGQTLV